MCFTCVNSFFVKVSEAFRKIPREDSFKGNPNFLNFDFPGIERPEAKRPEASASPVEISQRWETFAIERQELIWSCLLSLRYNSCDAAKACLLWLSAGSHCRQWHVRWKRASLMLKAHDLGHPHPSLLPSRVHWCIGALTLIILKWLKGWNPKHVISLRLNKKKGEVDSAQRALQPPNGPNTPCCVQWWSKMMAPGWSRMSA